MKKKGRDSKDIEETIQDEMEERKLRKSQKYERRYKHGGPRRTLKKRKGI